MTREEFERSFQYNMTNAFVEWDKAVNTEYNEDNEIAFYEGAYAAQKYLVEKACEWLESSIRPYAGYSETSDIVDAFKEAMEE